MYIITSTVVDRFYSELKFKARITLLLVAVERNSFLVQLVSLIVLHRSIVCYQVKQLQKFSSYVSCNYS